MWGCQIPREFTKRLSHWLKIYNWIGTKLIHKCRTLNFIVSMTKEPHLLWFQCRLFPYRKGLIYLEVPIEEADYIVVPPLEGFVMNRVLGDYFETLLYKIFVSIDEHTSVGEVSHGTWISLYCFCCFLLFAHLLHSVLHIAGGIILWHQDCIYSLQNGTFSV